MELNTAFLSLRGTATTFSVLFSLAFPQRQARERSEARKERRGDEREGENRSSAWGPAAAGSGKFLCAGGDRSPLGLWPLGRQELCASGSLRLRPPPARQDCSRRLLPRRALKAGPGRLRAPRRRPEPRCDAMRRAALHGRNGNGNGNATADGVAAGARVR